MKSACSQCTKRRAPFAVGSAPAHTKRVLRPALAVLLVAAGAGCTHDPDHDVLSRLREQATHAAAINQGAAQTILAVKTTDARFQAWTSNRAPGADAKVWVVEVTGHFRCTYCHEASGAVGTAMTFTYDATGKTELASSFRTSVDDLSPLGTVLRLK